MIYVENDTYDMLKLFVIFLILIISVTVNPIFAYHVYENPILYVEVNWINEPVIATEQNGIELLIIDMGTGEPISGLQDELRGELIFEGEKITLLMEEDHKIPGRYVSWIIPMLEGEYTVNILGEPGVPVSRQFKLPPVEEISYVQFPTISESESTSFTETSQSIKEEIEQIKEKISKEDNNYIIYVSMILAIIGIAIGSFAFTRKHKVKNG